MTRCQQTLRQPSAPVRCRKFSPMTPVSRTQGSTLVRQDCFNCPIATLLGLCRFLNYKPCVCQRRTNATVPLRSDQWPWCSPILPLLQRTPFSNLAIIRVGLVLSVAVSLAGKISAILVPIMLPLHEDIIKVITRICSKGKSLQSSHPSTKIPRRIVLEYEEKLRSHRCRID